MSLTSILASNNPENKEFNETLKFKIATKADFKTMSGKVPFSAFYMMQAKPVEWAQATLVGTAFDYAARFMIANKLSNKDLALKSTIGLVAEIGARKFNGIGLYNNITEEYNKHINNIRKYIIGSEQDITIKILESCIYLSLLERLARMPQKNMDETYKLLQALDIFHAEIEDLHNLCKVFKSCMLDRKVKKESLVVFNPKFGEIAFYIGGADADIYIDGALYDFKTTRKKGYTSVETGQLVGYYILAQYGNCISDTHSDLYGLNIDRLAFYKARFGEIEYINTADFDEKIIEDALNILRNRREKVSGVLHKICEHMEGMIKNETC